MGANISITDSKGLMTVIGSGRRPPAPITAAGQIVGWTEQSLVFWGSSTFNQAPFAAGGGDCLFDTGSLFCFAGPMSSDADNVLMVLWGFPPSVDVNTVGNGQLNSPPSAGLLVDGPIQWEIVAVN